MKKDIKTFNQDIEKFGGYEYTLETRLSSKIANARISKAIHSLVDFRGKRILDIGCGDGTYTSEFAALNPSSVLGLDITDAAIQHAKKKFANNSLFNFDTGSIYNLEQYYDKFDIVVVRGVLHHLDDPAKAIKQLIKTAPIVVGFEPNGYNPILKLIEKFSEYHIQHEEKSFTASKINSWFKDAGASMEKGLFVNTVPMFCPDWMAKFLHFFEPLAEALPLVKHFGCGQYIFSAKRIKS